MFSNIFSKISGGKRGIVILEDGRQFVSEVFKDQYSDNGALLFTALDLVGIWCDDMKEKLRRPRGIKFRIQNA